MGICEGSGRWWGDCGYQPSSHFYIVIIIIVIFVIIVIILYIVIIVIIILYIVLYATTISKTKYGQKSRNVQLTLRHHVCQAEDLICTKKSNLTRHAPSLVCPRFSQDFDEWCSVQITIELSLLDLTLHFNFSQDMSIIHYPLPKHLMEQQSAKY